MSNRHRMPMNWGDYLADTGHLTATEHGAYLLLICHYWRTGGLPADEQQIRRITKMTARQWSSSRDIVRAFFGDNWRHKRIDQEIAQATEKSKVNSANAKLSHSERTSERTSERPATTPTPITTTRKKRLPAAEPPEFQDFWASIPHREGSNPRFPAVQAYIRAIKNGADPMQINAAAKKWNAETEKIDRYVKTAVAWLNARMYEDYHVEAQNEKRPGS